MSVSGAIRKFEVYKARESANKMITNARDMKNACMVLQKLINSMSWWKGDSKSGFTRRAISLLEVVDSTADCVLGMGDDLLIIAKQKEDEERSLRNAMFNQQFVITAEATSEGGNQ